MDPYETGFYDFRWQEKRIDDRSAYWNSDKPANKTELKEYGFSDQFTSGYPVTGIHRPKNFCTMKVQSGIRHIFARTQKAGARYFIYFGAVNYKADVYLNGKKPGDIRVGLRLSMLKCRQNCCAHETMNWCCNADNRRYKDEIPTLNTDWRESMAE